MQNFTLFEEFITLGKFLKEIGAIHTGGAAKAFLAENHCVLNGEEENRRGKKLYNDDILEIPALDLTVQFQAATAEEIEERKAEQAEKERVQAIVKKLNAENKKPKEKKPAKPQSPFHK